MGLDKKMNKNKVNFTPKKRLMRRIYCPKIIEFPYFIDYQLDNLKEAMLNVKKINKKYAFFGLKLIIKNLRKNYLIYCNLMVKAKNKV